jgi:hypothetical protein
VARPQKYPFETGQKFGRWTTIEETKTAKGKRAALVECSCEAKTQKVIDYSSLTSGLSTSCGCYNREVASQKAFKRNAEHGNTWATTHGLARREGDSYSKRVESLYDKWVAMMDRCYNPDSIDYKRYGGRGIQVAFEWHKPPVFIEWLKTNLGECPPDKSLDRIDNNGNYEPGNVRWATAAEQAANKGY